MTEQEFLIVNEQKDYPKTLPLLKSRQLETETTFIAATLSSKVLANTQKSIKKQINHSNSKQ